MLTFRLPVSSHAVYLHDYRTGAGDAGVLLEASATEQSLMGAESLGGQLASPDSGDVGSQRQDFQVRNGGCDNTRGPPSGVGA